MSFKKYFRYLYNKIFLWLISEACWKKFMGKAMADNIKDAIATRPKKRPFDINRSSFKLKTYA